MKNEPHIANVSYHGESWGADMMEDCKRAAKSIHISALSMLAPTKNGSGSWPDLWNAWCAAAQQGVRIDIWLAAPSGIHPATRANVSAGYAIIGAGMYVHYITGNRLLHAKTAIIDAEIAWIGSGNFTAAAAHFNHEAYARIESEKIARQLITRWEGWA
jgi:phosphatidylserine/phosphatidylglycerophosphate/cardiolipin synthase-like enzyme